MNEINLFRAGIYECVLCGRKQGWTGSSRAVPCQGKDFMMDHLFKLIAEREARKYGLSYVKLDGDIGCMVNGAGLAMASLDVIKLSGGEPANFLDIGGGASADKVSAGLRIILTDPNVKVVLINVFGGITRCDEVARGILAALEEEKPEVPMVIRLVGTNEEEGQRLLSTANLVTVSSLIEAAELAVTTAKEQPVG